MMQLDYLQKESLLYTTQRWISAQHTYVPTSTHAHKYTDLLHSVLLHCESERQNHNDQSAFDSEELSFF